MILDPVRLQTLVLARAATSSKPMTAAAIAKDTERFAPSPGPEWTEAVAAALAALRADKLLDDKNAVLDKDSLAKRLDGSAKRKWQQLAERLIPALGLGMASKDAFAKGALAGRDGWATAIIGRSLKLWTSGAVPTTSTLCDLIVWRLLGLSSKPKRSPNEVRAHFLQRELQTSPGPLDRLLRLLAARELGVQPTDLKVWRNALGQRWLTRSELGNGKASTSTGTPAAAPPSFVDDVLRVAASVEDDARIGGRKVFLAMIWDSLRHTPAWRELSLDAFKQRILEAHRASKISLARADFVSGMDPDLVDRSETVGGGGASLHFLELPDALASGDAV